MRARNVVLSAILALAILSCGDPGTPVEPTAYRPPPGDGDDRPVPAPPAPVLALVAGDTQVSVPRGLVYRSLQVRASDSLGNPLRNLLVRWQADNGGRLESDTTRTNHEGVANARWILGPSSGTYAVTATAGAAQPVRFSARADTTLARVDIVTTAPLSMTSFGDTATIRIRLMRGANVFYAPIMRLEGGNNAVAVRNAWPAVQLEARANGAAEYTTWFGDLALPFRVEVRQVPARGVLALAGDPEPNGDTVIILPGQERRLEVAFLDARGHVVAGETRQVAGWHSENLAVATVDDGLLSGRASGSTRVGARADTASAVAPVRVGLLRPQQIEVGTERACAISDGATLACWGGNDWLGGGSVAPEMQAYGRFVALAIAALHVCGLRPDGAAVCWGYNRFGELGNGTWSTAATTQPQRVQGNQRFTAIGTGMGHSCGLTGDGSVWCWGYNGDGRLGVHPASTGYCRPSYQCSATPVLVASTRRFVQLAVGENHACALDSDGLAWCWGSNMTGALGTTATGHGPRPVAGDHRFRSISAGRLHSCAVDITGRAWCWGDNMYAQLGSADAPIGNTPYGRPAPVAGDARFVSIEAAEHYSCGLTPTGEAWCWGFNLSGQLGSGSALDPDCNGGNCVALPRQVSGGIRFRTLSLGNNSCGISTDGIAYCWGYGPNGANGDGTRATRYVPTRVMYQP